MEPLADFGPPGSRGRAEPVAGFEGGFDFVANAGFSAVDFVDELIESAILPGWFGIVVAGEETLDFSAKLPEVFLAAGCHDDLGVGD